MLLSNWPKFTLKSKADLYCLISVFNTEMTCGNTPIANGGNNECPVHLNR